MFTGSRSEVCTDRAYSMQCIVEQGRHLSHVIAIEYRVQKLALFAVMSP